MLDVMVLVLAMVAIVVAAWWPSGDTEPDTAEGDPGGPSPQAQAPTSLEGTLVAQVMHGGISPAQYRHALAGLAWRDEARHPLSVPHDDPPGELPRGSCDGADR
ncbi:hypothetical protein [Actinoplanes sp. NPDC020271]|uniref:hypothetical protein n=1 Tax=Actinoplanes sp. NPDC020271 TaxID=3363896 RepID=UPI003795A66E